MSVRPCRSLALLVVVLLSVVSCGGAGGGDESGPSFSPTRTPTRSPTLEPPSPRAAPPGPRHRRRPRADRASEPTSEPTSAPRSRAPPAAHAQPSPSSPTPEPSPTSSPTPSRPELARPRPHHAGANPSRSPTPEPSPTSSSPVPTESPTPTTASPTASESAGEDVESTRVRCRGRRDGGVDVVAAGRRTGRGGHCDPVAAQARAARCLASRSCLRAELTGRGSHASYSGGRQAPSSEEMVGGWAVASSRVTAAEDRLTALETTGPDDGRPSPGTCSARCRSSGTHPDGDLDEDRRTRHRGPSTSTTSGPISRLRARTPSQPTRVRR